MTSVSSSNPRRFRSRISAAVGLSLVLDIFDPGAAKQFDEEMGINHTNLFFELNHLDASGLGESHRLHVGDTTWSAGIMFEF